METNGVQVETMETQVRIEWLNRIELSTTNPRRTLRDMEELTKSVREKGVIQPLLTRPKSMHGIYPVTFEVVCGERRYRAAKAAGLEKVPILIRELSDDEAIECQVIENNQRRDPDPLEEAAGFKALLDRGQTAKELAARLGRSESYVYARIRLADLVEAGADALDRELLTLSGALLIAQLSAEQQAEVLKNLAAECYWDSKQEYLPPRLASRAQVKRRIKDTARSLKLAPWALDDAALVPEAGPCASCPKRTGAQRDLFGAAEGDDDRCLDEACWSKKCEAAWAATKAKAAAAGQTVLEREAAKEAQADVHRFQRANGETGFKLGWDAPFKLLDEEADELEDDLGLEDELDSDEPTPLPSWREVLKTAGVEVPIVLTRDQDGRTHEVVAVAELIQALEKTHPISTAQMKRYYERMEENTAANRGSADRYKEQQKAEKEARKLLDATRERAVGHIVDQVEGVGLSSDETLEVLAMAVCMANRDGLLMVCRRRGWGVAENSRGEANILMRARVMTLDEIHALLVEVLVAGYLTGRGWLHGNQEHAGSPFQKLLKSLGIDYKSHKKQAREALKPKKKASKKSDSKKAPAEKAPAKKKSSSKKPPAAAAEKAATEEAIEQRRAARARGELGKKKRSSKASTKKKAPAKRASKKAPAKVATASA